MIAIFANVDHTFALVDEVDILLPKMTIAFSNMVWPTVFWLIGFWMSFIGIFVIKRRPVLGDVLSASGVAVSLVILMAGFLSIVLPFIEVYQRIGS